MRRFFVPPENWTPEQVTLPEDLARHVGTVLRIGAGEILELLDGEGRCARCRLVELHKKSGLAAIEEIWQEVERQLPVTLLQGLPKGDKFDWLLQKTTELGLDALIPVVTERVVTRLEPGRAEKRMKRWERIVQEAARQSCRPQVPRVFPPLALAEAVSQVQAPLRIMLWEDASRPLHEVLPAAPPSSVAILVGPEGGLSRQDARQAEAAGFLPVGLGPRILRTETAGMAILPILQYVYGDLGPLGGIPR